MLDGMTAIHTARHVYGPQGRATLDYTEHLKAMKMLGSTDAEREMEHPVVRTHPETGRKCLYINQGFTTRFKDMTVEGKSAAARIFVGTLYPAGIHLPLSLGARFGCFLG